MTESIPPMRFLVVATRQIGDVLLVTPLIKTLRMSYPDARIDVLVFRDKGHVLEGNPHLDALIEVSERPSIGEYFAFIRMMFRRYSIAVNTQTNDRAHLFAFVAAPVRIGPIYERDWHSAWKRFLSARWVWFDDISTHTVYQNLKLAKIMGLHIKFDVVPPRVGSVDIVLREVLGIAYPSRFAVFHINPMWPYKRWTREGWLALIHHVRALNYQVLISGGPEDHGLCHDLAAEFKEGVVSIAGRVGFGELANILSKADFYVGPDTAVTHLAASTGTRTLAIYGPSNPVKWGPWPCGYQGEDSPWVVLARPWQLVGNVLLLQAVQPQDRGRCVPCFAEGCDRHKQSASVCMEQLDVSVVIDALSVLLDQPTRR
jgi:heptosyltransferase III